MQFVSFFLFYLCCVHRSAPLIMGVDTEWGDSGDGCALVQVAFFHRIFLLDTRCPCRPAVAELLVWLFSHTRIIKLGFSFGGDWPQLELLRPGIRNESKQLFDMQHFLCRSLPHVAASASGQPGLSSLANAVLGFPIDKAEQCSDWCARPLRQSQLRYAALDALVLIDIFWAMIPQLKSELSAQSS